MSVLTEEIILVAQAARNSAHGQKEQIYSQACERLGLSRATLLKYIKTMTVTPTRKRRNDAGKTALTMEEAKMISAVLIESTRKNNKRLYSIEDAVNELRANNLIRAESVDENTGEVRELSASTIIRALRNYGLHPDQLSAPAPHAHLKSNHPNHVWQIDASLCTLYYLSNGQKGLQVMAADQFYKNKPKNLARIAHERVWSYELTDHTSGWIYVEYVLGAESGDNLCSVLINAMQERGGADVLHGVPQIIFVDPGSANTAGMTKNLCKSLGIELIAHSTGNARATGQVEKARDIIERKFEPGLKFRPVNNLEELNELAKRWRENFNATAIHSRHGKTRNDIWLKITESQLIKAPRVEDCKELAVATPEKRKVQASLEVSFRGKQYDVSTVPNVMIGESIMVTRNPWRTDSAQVVLFDADGKEYYHLIDEVKTDEFGFAENAATIGSNFKQQAETNAQRAQKDIELLVTGASTQDEAAAHRKAKNLPFNGQFDPYKSITDHELPAYMPKRGMQSDAMIPRREIQPLTHVEAAKLLKEKVSEWSAEHFKWLVKNFPEGIQEEQLNEVAELLNQNNELNKVVNFSR